MKLGEKIEKLHLEMSLVHCSWDSQISLFSNFFIKNGFHDTIHTFKNYFATVFSIFNFQFSAKISSIQTEPKSLDLFWFRMIFPAKI